MHLIFGAIYIILTEHRNCEILKLLQKYINVQKSIFMLTCIFNKIIQDCKVVITCNTHVMYGRTEGHLQLHTFTMTFVYRWYARHANIAEPVNTGEAIRSDIQ